MTCAENELTDLRLFADPFSPDDFKLGGDDIWTAEFERKGKRVALRRDRDGKIYSLETDSLVAGSFRALLASKDFADIKYLSRAIKHAYRDSNENWMEVFFNVDRGSDEVKSFGEIENFLSGLVSGAVVGLEGPAGSGKTHFIERLAFSRAERILGGTSGDPLVIPITSAGKILSAIGDRIDGSLGALRANFNRDELPALMRRRLISIAIDGFDELSDSRGYNDSWSALREIIADVGGESMILLAGRDSFIGIDTLKSLIGTSVKLAGSDLHSIRLDFPTPESATDWICDSNSDWTYRSTELKERLSSYYWLRRPFFVSQISEIEPTKFLDSGDEPIIILCEEIVAREVKKLGLPSNITEEFGKKIVYSILTEAARTMVDYEIDHVDASLLEVAVELACEEHASGQDSFRRALTSRAKTLTLLEPASGTGDRDNRTFPHEKVKAYFYSCYLMSELSNEATLPLGIRRSQLSISDLAVFRALLSLQTPALSQDLANYLSEQLKLQSIGSTTFSNLAAIGIACASDLPVERPFTILAGSVIDAVAVEKPSIKLENIYINRFDATDADLRSSVFQNCEIGEFLISSVTQLGTTRPSVNTLVYNSLDGSEEMLYDQDKVVSKLAGISAASTNSSTEEDLSLPLTLDIFARMMMKSHWIRLSREDKRGRRLVERSDWQFIREKLESSGFLEVKNIGAGGKPDEFAHLKNAGEFLRSNITEQSVRDAIRSMSD